MPNVRLHLANGDVMMSFKWFLGQCQHFANRFEQINKQKQVSASESTTSTTGGSDVIDIQVDVSKEVMASLLFYMCCGYVRYIDPAHRVALHLTSWQALQLYNFASQLGYRELCTRIHEDMPATTDQQAALQKKLDDALAVDKTQTLKNSRWSFDRAPKRGNKPQHDDMPLTPGPREEDEYRFVPRTSGYGFADTVSTPTALDSRAFSKPRELAARPSKGIARKRKQQTTSDSYSAGASMSDHASTPTGPAAVDLSIGYHVLLDGPYKAIAMQAADQLGNVTVISTTVDKISNRQALTYPDVVLKSNHDKTFRCHKAILARRCEYFRTLFSTNFKESSCNVVELPDVGSNVLGAVLDYLYSDTIPLSSAITKKPQKMCDALVFADRIFLLEARFVEQIDCNLHQFVDNDTVIPLMQVGCKYGLEKVKSACCHVAAFKTDAVTEPLITDFTKAVPVLTAGDSEEVLQNQALVSDLAETATKALTIRSRHQAHLERYHRVIKNNRSLKPFDVSRRRWYHRVIDGAHTSSYPVSSGAR
eukprot:GFYU01005621.1.p1 GENE.GFYU01005621.1~~GFYU01005621.1.p1  ORF type:complete len:535 (-),score=100.11 GFYU01005621.1:126-1730(-)